MMVMRMLAALSCVLLLGCAGATSSEAPPTTAGQVDLERYQGTWYELARLPMFFQRNCLESEANYRLQDDASVAVINRCRTTDGDWQQAVGQAVVQEPERTDRLWVRFDNWFSRLFPQLTRGHYWILFLDDDYQSVLVGSPDREYLWLMARTPQVSAPVRDRLLKEAQARGYLTESLVWRGEQQ